MVKKIKIALLLTGGLRNFEDTFETFKYFLLDKFDIDVFFYGLENKFGETSNNKFLEMFKPKSYSINNNQYYDEIILKNKYIKSSYYSFYNVFKCNQLRNEYQKENNIEYDIVIRSRLDFFWFRPITEQEIESSSKTILIPEEWSFKNVNDFALSDIFCITNPELMDKYCDLYNYIDQYCETMVFHPESLIGYHIKNNKLKYKEIPRHFVFEYPTTQTYKYIPKGYKFIQHYEIGHNKKRKDFD